MGTRYSRRTTDGITEYHDSKESLIQAECRESSETLSIWFGWIGLLVGGVLTYVAFLKLGGMEWPKWARFIGILIGASAGAFTLAKFADLICTLVVTAILIAIVSSIGIGIWQLL